MNTKALHALIQHADLWAKAYTAVYDALIRQGTPPSEARFTAGQAASLAAIQAHTDVIPGDEWKRAKGDKGEKSE